MLWPRVVLSAVVVTFLLQSCGVRGESVQCRNGSDYISATGAPLNPVLERYEAVFLLLVGFGGLAILLAVAYNVIRRYVFHEIDNVDSTFDAGGNVSASLTAVTVAAQLLWPADLMQSVTFAVKFGIAGPFWYSATPAINMALFPYLSSKFKIRAPGAKTFLQILLVRFGRPTHLLYTVYALCVNAVVMATILVGGIAVLQATVVGASPEFCLLVIIIMCASYSIIGGLGSTFYVSYLNIIITFVTLIVLIVEIMFVSKHPVGTLDEIYDRVNCLPGVKGNRDGSRFTFFSEDAIVLAIQAVFLSASIVYCDQANWQSRVAAKPLPGAVGLLAGAFLWICVPFSIGLMTGITYLSEAALNETVALHIEQIDAGIVSTYMSERVLGTRGVIMMLIMITMLTMSTGASEILGISSILVYDIYRTYINPYRRKLHHRHCIICGKTKRNQDAIASGIDGTGERDDLICDCPSVLTCQPCKEDIKNASHASKSLGKVVVHKCPHHSHYRNYQDGLINIKNWCMLWVSMFLLPFGLFLFETGVDLNWLIFCGIIILVPSFPGVIMSFTWTKVTGSGLIIGSVCGLLCGVSSNLLVSYLHYDGEGGFIRATSSTYSVLAGSGSGTVVSTVIIILVSLCTHNVKTAEDEEEIWRKLRDIDNPLQPWCAQYEGEFPEYKGALRPMHDQLAHLSRHARWVSLIGFVVFIAIFIVIIPAVILSFEVMSADEFKGWVIFVTAWLMVSAVIIIITTPAQEVFTIVREMLRSKRTAKEKGGSKDASVSNGLDNKAFEQDTNKADPVCTTKI